MGSARMVELAFLACLLTWLPHHSTAIVKPRLQGSPTEMSLLQTDSSSDSSRRHRSFSNGHHVLHSGLVTKESQSASQDDASASTTTDKSPGVYGKTTDETNFLQQREMPLPQETEYFLPPVISTSNARSKSHVHVAPDVEKSTYVAVSEHINMIPKQTGLRNQRVKFSTGFAATTASPPHFTTPIQDVVESTESRAHEGSPSYIEANAATVDSGVAREPVLNVPPSNSNDYFTATHAQLSGKQ